MHQRTSLIALTLGGTLLGLSLLTSADAHDRDQGRAAAPADPLYSKECGSCHLAYPPRLLPAGSWERLLGDLGNHFGESAELSQELTRRIRTYLVTAADTVRSGSEPPPLRISATDHFRREHREIPSTLVTGNPAVKSFSNCGACHGDATAGSFDERAVLIPGQGPWQD
jgi:hypothetical protein